MGLLRNIRLARDAARIAANGRYCVGGNEVVLPRADFQEVEVVSPEDGAAMIAECQGRGKPDGCCAIRVVAEDSFEAAMRYERPLVMSFANAHCPGGGFWLGANAQEESLCRRSTLYASISSKKAACMYRRNNTRLCAVESDYMLYSPNVCVFMDGKGELLQKPFMASVVTVPAPNRRGAAFFASGRRIGETMLRRIKIMLLVAAKHGHRNLVLGAWGCGAFGNKPRDVAGLFMQALVEEGLGGMFDEVCFAIRGRTDDAKFRAFKDLARAEGGKMLARAGAGKF